MKCIPSKINCIKLLKACLKMRALELIEYVDFMKRKHHQLAFKDLDLTSETSLGFWDNELDPVAVFNNIKHFVNHLPVLLPLS